MARKFEFVIEGDEDKVEEVERIALKLQESDSYEGGVDLVRVDCNGSTETYILTFDVYGVIHMHSGNDFAGHEDGERLTVEYD